MIINHFETCGKCHGVHFSTECLKSKPLIGTGTLVPINNYELDFGNDTPYDIRKAGYSVAVHNDYKMHNIDCTFWLFTKMIGDKLIAVKGEGITDIIALDQIREQILKVEKTNE